MTLVKPKFTTTVKKQRPNLWFEKIMAIIAVVNLLLVIFDLSYVPLRDFWLHGQVRLGNLKSAYVNIPGIKIDILPSNVSQFVLQYDEVKGITPNRTTEKYLEKVANLETQLATNPLNSPEITPLLSDLRRRSLEIIQNNAFAEAGKSGNLERIKNKMREHLPNTENSAQQAFWQFWSVNHLQKNTAKELEFFNSEIQPILETNYYRHIGETGGYVDNFGLIDFPFGAIFALEFLTRTWFISRTRTGVNWLDAMFWRWYDVFLFLPFWRWLRVIPILVRLQRSQLLPLNLGNRIQKQISQGIVAGIAEDITEVVVIRIINQLQISIRQGDISRLLAEHNQNNYIDLNNTNETVEIIKIFANTIVEGVLPKIQPEAEALLQYSLEKAIQQSPAYQGISLLPGGKNAVSTLTKQLVTQTYQGFVVALKAVVEEDQKFEQLIESLFTNISRSFVSEMKAQQSLNQIENLLIDLLEEIKINYVERLSTEDVEQILEQTRSIRQIAQR
jgi:hypothetical protein